MFLLIYITELMWLDMSLNAKKNQCAYVLEPDFRLKAVILSPAKQG